MALLDTRHKKKSFWLTTILLSLFLLLLFYIGLTYMDPPIENGITVNFGYVDYGKGPAPPRPQAQPQPVQEEELEEEAPEEQLPEPAEEQVEETIEETESEKVLTQESEESIKIKQQQAEKRKAEEAAKKAKAEAERLERERLAAEEKARQERAAKKKQLDELMGGLNNAEGADAEAEGDDQGVGDKGQPDGDPYANTYYGSPGSGSGTGGYGLSGRSLLGNSPVKQTCNEEGRVVVEIRVDRNGKVVSARPGVKGTTNTDPCLLGPARKTALSYKWNPDSKAPDQQIGFVVVNFKLGE
ncbi:energy transducer TonB [Flavobacteriaceae bacterium D16]|nr:energy transducer TonB [Flavobacteriaceae bacterium D16]